MNLDDARRVFTIYDDNRGGKNAEYISIGTITAIDLKMIFIDMGYGFVANPEYADYFEEITRTADAKNVLCFYLFD